MPVSLSPGSKDDYVVHVMPLLKQHGACECGAKSCYLGGVEKSSQLTGVVEKSETTVLCGS